jgi:cell division protease FtsH
MGSLGPVAFETQDEQPFLGYQMSHGRDYSEATTAKIDREVEQLLGERHKAVSRLLREARGRLDALASRLLEEETVSGAELAQILGPRPTGARVMEPVDSSARAQAQVAAP